MSKQLPNQMKLTKEEYKKLLKAADEARKNTYPNSGIGYAAAVLTKKGNIYQGASYISDTDTLTMHSEALALAHAAQHGEKEVIAITGVGCHICKQLMYENSLRSGIDMIVVFEEDGEIKQIPISQIMNYPWPSKTTQSKLDKIKVNKVKKTAF